MYKITVPAAVWQWDINDTITVEGIEDISKWQVHFATVGDSNALVLEINPDMTCYIPNQLVELGQAIYAYLYNVEDQRAYTETAVLISVKARPRPLDYISEPTDVLTWGQLRADIGTLSELLTEDKTNLVAAVNELHGDIETAYSKIDSIETDMTEQGQSITAIQSGIKKIEQSIANINDTDTMQSQQIAQNRQDIDALEQSDTQLTKSVSSLAQTVDKGFKQVQTELDKKQPVGDYITNAVDNLVNYYLKSETYTRDEVNDLVKSLTHINIRVVSSIDDVTEPNVIYLIPVSGGESNDYYNEYILVNGSPELIGNTRVDLSDYYTREQTDDLLSRKQPIGNYVTSVNGNVPDEGCNVSIDVQTYTAGEGIDISNTGAISVTNPMDDEQVSAGTTWSSARIAGVLEQAGVIRKYGILWDKVEATCTRLWDAAGITTTTSNFGHFGAVNPNYDNPFDSIYPWSERRVCNYDMRVLKTIVADGYDVLDAVTAWEGEETFSYDPAEGLGVGVYTPEFWYTAYDTAEGRVFGVSGAPIEGWYYSEPIIAGRWLGVVEQLDGVSVLGCRVGMPSANISCGTLHAYANNFGMTIDDIYSWDADTTLQIIEYANMNTQVAIGNGVSDLYRQNETDLIQEDATESTIIKVVAANASNAIPGAIIDIGTSNGGLQVARRYVVSTAADEANETLLCITLNEPVTVTTSNYWSIHGLINVADEEIGSMSGYIGTNGKCNTYYRGKVLFGNKFVYVLGAWQEGQTNHIWITKSRYEAETIISLDTSSCVDTGLILPWGEGDTAIGGYINEFGLVDGLAAAPFCTALGGSSANPVGDYCFILAKSATNHVLFAGGLANSGSGDGRFCANWGAVRGSSSWDLSASPSSKTSRRGVRGVSP